jgi:hypothetical protein
VPTSGASPVSKGSAVSCVIFGAGLDAGDEAGVSAPLGVMSWMGEARGGAAGDARSWLPGTKAPARLAACKASP